MTNGNDEVRDVDTAIEPDDELRNLFSSFDEVSASNELKDATLARIFALAAEEDEAAGDGSVPVVSPSAGDADAPSTTTEITAVAGGKADRMLRSAKRSRWRTIRIAAVAACLALALAGGAAYATPAAYYEIEQDGTTITLAVNCFGITVDAASDSAVGAEIIESTDLRNMPYEDSLAHAIESMEQRSPDKPVEFGPQGGDREVVNQQEPQDDTASPDGGRPQEQGQPPAQDPSQDGGQQGQGQQEQGRQEEGQPQGEREATPDGEAPPSQGPAGEPEQPGDRRP